ncbi:MAG TPA: Gfo/Idh/MocA family oxidoreductase [Anaerolineales bacterium]|nr:Gfo/Idh/MocA family oxidoreductase [Anaerolineales bacterium]
MTLVKVGLIGCGRIAQAVHINILTRLAGTELVALADPDPQRREEAKRRAPAATAFTDYQELLEGSDVEAVVICLPNALHAEVAVAALQKSKHVYLEKPLATTLAEGRQVLAAWRQAGTVGMIGFNFRFNALYQSMKEHIQSGRLGELVSVRSVFSSPVRTLPAWKQSRHSGGGVLFDLASHHIDLIRFFFGQEICEVFAGLRSQRTEVDSAMLQLRLADGLLVQSFFSLNAGDDDRFEIYGQAGRLAVDRYLSLDVEITGPTREFARLKRWMPGVPTLARSRRLLESILAPNDEPSYRAALAHFVAAARADQPAKPNFWDGYRSLVVVAAAEESVRTGRVVSLSDVPDEDFAR